MKVLSLKNVEDMKHDPIPFEGGLRKTGKVRHLDNLWKIGARKDPFCVAYGPGV